MESGDKTSPLRCHEYAKLMIERLHKFKEGFEQFKKNCYEYEAGASCHSAGHMLLQGIDLPDGTTPVRTWFCYILKYCIIIEILRW